MAVKTSTLPVDSRDPRAGLSEEGKGVDSNDRIGSDAAVALRHLDPDHHTEGAPKTLSRPERGPGKRARPKT